MAPTGPIAVVGVNGALPSESTCAARVVRTAENRPGNTTFNNTRGSSPNNENSRVTGNFVGTTDEIIQWAACKWGLSADWARAQATIESNWHQDISFGDAIGMDSDRVISFKKIGQQVMQGRVIKNRTGEDYRPDVWLETDLNLGRIAEVEHGRALELMEDIE